MQIILETPLRLRVQNRILDPQSLEMRPLLTTLLRRLSVFACCYGTALLTANFSALAETAALVVITQRHLDWFKWQRYSSSQGRYIAMDGVVGMLEIDLSQAPEWWPFLWVGQWVQVGKGVSMGMGRYQLLAVN